MRLLADVLLDSDMCLPDGAAPLVIRDPNGAFELTLANTDRAEAAPEGVLSAQLTFEAEDIVGSRETAEAHLAVALNALTFVTGRMFKTNTIKLIIDWTLGINKRQLLCFVETPIWDEAEPALTTEYTNAAETVLHTHRSEKQQRAQRWFRLGVQTNNVEEQFSYFWFALEISAEAIKDKEKVPSLCPHCQTALYCEKCETHPVHRKYQGQAIQAAVERIIGSDGHEVFQGLQRIRHALMHGDRIASVIDKTPFDVEKAINTLHFVTRHALLEMGTDVENAPHEELSMGYVEDIRRGRVLGIAHVEFSYPGDPNDPKLTDMPAFDFTVDRAPARSSTAGE